MPAAFSAGVDEEKDVLVARGCVLKTLHFVNADAGLRYIQVFDAALAASVTLGTTPPTYVVPMGTSATGTIMFWGGLPLRSGCVVCATTTPTGNTPVTADAFVSVTFD